jgi:DNA-binding transcriptional regulator YdaS (Cro superfamily)
MKQRKDFSRDPEHQSARAKPAPTPEGRKLAKSGGTVETLIDDLGGTERAARLLGVHAATVRRWKRGATPIPRASLRALYALSQWGRLDRAVMTRNHLATLNAHVAALQRELAEWKTAYARLVEIADFGSANAPDIRPTTQIAPPPVRASADAAKRGAA